MLSPRAKAFFGNSIPFGMTFGAFCMIIMCGLSGIGNNIMGPIFTVETKNLNIPPSAFSTGVFSYNISNTDARVSGNNITAASLQLADKYSFYIWTYSSTTGGKTNYSSSNFDYFNKINIPTTVNTIDGVAVEIPGSLINLRNTLRDLTRLAEVFLLAAVVNCFFVVGLGIVACFDLKFRPLIIYMFTGIALFTTAIFVGDITAAGAVATSDLKQFKKFGVDSKMGTRMVAIAWMAIIHTVVVFIMWLLMGFRMMRPNPAVRWKVPTKSLDSQRSEAGLAI